MRKRRLPKVKLKIPDKELLKTLTYFEAFNRLNNLKPTTFLIKNKIHIL